MWGTRHAQTISTMVRVSCLALTIASGALALTMCVMRGFEQSGHQLLQGIHAPILMSAGLYGLDYEPIKIILETDFPEVASFSPRDTQHAIIKDPVSGELSAPVLLLGVLPEHEHQTTQIERYLTHTLFKQPFPFNALLQDDRILIGERLASLYQLKVGDMIELVYSPDTKMSGSKLYLSSNPAQVSGIFKTGLEEVDASTVYCSLNFLERLFPDTEVTSIAIKPTAQTSQAALIARLQERFGLDVYSWQALYPALVSALQLEKYAMFLILSLIILIASMTILALLYMQIQHKRGDIAVLHALGVSTHTITQIFMWMGITIAALSSLVGLSCAWIIAWSIERFKLIPLPADSYFISYLPVSLEPHLFILIFLFVIAIATIATWIPCRSLHTVSISRLLKNQA